MPNMHIDDLSRPGNDDFLVPYKLAQIDRPSDVLLVADPVQSPGGGTPTTVGFGFDAQRDLIALDDFRFYNHPSGEQTYLLFDLANNFSPSRNGLPIYAGSNRDTRDNRQNLRFRHGGDESANVLHVDGHVGKYSLDPAPVGTVDDNGEQVPVYDAADLLGKAINVATPRSHNPPDALSLY